MGQVSQQVWFTFNPGKSRVYDKAWKQYEHIFFHKLYNFSVDNVAMVNLSGQT